MLERLPNISLEKKIAGVLVVVIILLLGMGYVSYRSTDDLINREVRVAQTHHVRETIERLLYQMEDIEDKQRLDLFSGDNQFLQSSREATHSIDQVIRRLTTLTSEDQTQQQHILVLRRLIDLRMTQLKNTIDLRNAGRLRPDQQHVQLHAGKDTMDQILLLLHTMGEQEQSQLITWSRQADGAASFTHAFIIGGTLGTVVLALAGGWIIFYDLSKRRQAEQAAMIGHARQALILRSLPIVMYSAKRSGDYGAFWVSENIEMVAGFPAQSFLDDSSLWASRLHPDDRDKTLMKFNRLSETDALSTEYRWQRHDGEYRWFRDQAMLIRQPDGAPQELIGLWTDVTGERHANELIRRQANIIEQIQESVITVDLNGYVMSWNNGAKQLLGYTAQEAIGKHISFVYPEEDHEFLEQHVMAPVKAKGTHHVEIRRRTKSGALRFAQLSLTLLRNDSGDPIGIVGYSMDITDRKRGEEALLKSRNQLAALAVRLESVREEERGRIALEVHDVLGQALTGLKLDISWVYKQLVESHGSFEPSSVLARLAMSLKLVDATIQSVREIATTLRPSVLDQLGLEAAIEWQAQEFRHRTGITCASSISPDHIHVDAQQSTALFRILQEVLTNVVRHAHATEVDIRLEETREHVMMQIRDNGKGITTVEQSGPQAFGLLGMRLRTQQQGGTFDIQGTSGKGTTVTVKIPLVHTNND
ncbi:PAS domain-containing protein [Nitrospira sp. BLG_1]|uniref:PAS domain-containing protein n=1 Tax=Nitrospira sp. BLG_1 TaxID=3395883 RepID=UPI0039BD08C4